MRIEDLLFFRKQLPLFVPDNTSYTDFSGVRFAFASLHNCFPELVAKPRRIIKSYDNQWAFAVTLGHGEAVTFIDILSHVGEILWAHSCVEYALFLCENPHLLSGRKIIFYFGDPAGAAVNMSRWGMQSHIFFSVLFRNKVVERSLYGHWRHPLPHFNDAWSFPPLGQEYAFEPTPGAQGAMQLLAEIKSSNDYLELLVLGHNIHIAYGTAVMQSGPQAAMVALHTERAIVKSGLNLDTTPQDASLARRSLPGTVASWEILTAAAMRAVSNYRGGDSLLDYAQRPDLFPDVAAHHTEVPHFTPSFINERMVPISRQWIDQRDVDRLVADTAPLQAKLLQLSELAAIIEPKVKSDRYISAVSGWKHAADIWDEPEYQPRGEVSGVEWFNYTVRAPLYLARNAGPAIAMLKKHGTAIRTHTGESPSHLRNELLDAFRRAVGLRGCYIWPVFAQKAIVGQILALETARYAQAGIVLE